MGEAAGQINGYHCATCGGIAVTVNRDAGTTPMMLACRATSGCSGMSSSMWYRVSQALTPEFEWYRPVGDEYARLDPAMKQHVDLGGLDIRRIGETKPHRAEVARG